MTKRERVLHAMDNKAVDRPPVSFWFHFPLDMDLDKDCVNAHLEYYRKCDIDFVKIMVSRTIFSHDIHSACANLNFEMAFKVLARIFFNYTMKTLICDVFGITDVIFHISC